MEVDSRIKAQKMADMSKNERFNLNKKRRYLLLNFLADGEYVTSAENTKMLFDVQHLSYVRRFLDTLIADEYLFKQSFSFGSTPKNYYSITEKGLAFVDVFERKIASIKLSHQTVWHNELCQRLHLIARKLIGVDELKWHTEIQIKRTKDNFASYPDALLRLNQTFYSIELQRNIYSYDGLVKKVQKCLKDVYSDNFHYVLFVCCENLNADRMKNMLAKIEKVRNSKNEEISLTDEDKSKFIIIDFKDYETWLKEKIN